MKQRLTGMLVYAKHGLLQLLQQLLSPHQHHQRCPSQSVSQGCFACIKTITETCEQIIPKKQQLFVEYPILKTLLGGASSMNPKSNKTLELMPLLMIAFKSNPEFAPKKKKDKKNHH
jgi:hypothetical protein